MAACAAALLFSAAPADAAPELSETTIYYDVRGVTATDLRREINASRPADKDGWRFDAITNWKVSWRFRYNKTNLGCAIKGAVETAATVRYNLPNWVDANSAPADLRNRWQRYHAALVVHEHGHGAIAASAADDVLRAIDALGAFATCAALEQAAHRTGREIIERYARFDDDYDRRTDHGRTQGARFP